MILESATAVVTGGASGLGRAVAQHVVDGGGRVALLDVNSELGEQTASELGSQAIFIETDVSSEDHVQQAIDKTVDSFGSVKLAVSCAGILGAAMALGKKGPMPASMFSKVLTINTFGTFLLARCAAGAMRDNPETENGERGVIDNTASVAAFEGQIGQVSYTAATAGIAGMTLTMARDLGSLGIRVNTIAPSLFATGLTARITDDRAENLVKDAAFPRRMGRPDEYARLAIAIIENPMLNGDTIRLDGGQRFAPK